MPVEVRAALAAAAVALLSSIIVAVFNHYTVRKAVRDEHSKGIRRLQHEKELQSLSEWRKDLRESISELVAEVDPFRPGNLNRDKVFHLIYRTQLVLNIDDDEHNELIGALNDLGQKVVMFETEKPTVKDVREAQHAVMVITGKLIHAPHIAEFSE